MDTFSQNLRGAGAVSGVRPDLPAVSSSSAVLMRSSSGQHRGQRTHINAQFCRSALVQWQTRARRSSRHHSRHHTTCRSDLDFTASSCCRVSSICRRSWLLASLQILHCDQCRVGGGPGLKPIRRQRSTRHHLTSAHQPHPTKRVSLRCFACIG
jgi:hypothetical protein